MADEISNFRGADLSSMNLDDLEIFIEESIFTEEGINAEQIKGILRSTYNTHCGVEQERFNSSVMQKLDILYGHDPKKLAVRGLEIISGAGETHVSALPDYLDGVITEEQLEFARKRPEVMRKLIDGIGEELRTGTSADGSPYSANLRGVVLFGSYAYMSFDKGSDMDAQFITNDGSREGTDGFPTYLLGLSDVELDSPNHTYTHAELVELLEELNDTVLIITPFDEVEYAVRNTSIPDDKRARVFLNEIPELE